MSAVLSGRTALVFACAFSANRIVVAALALFVFLSVRIGSAWIEAAS